MTPQTVRAVLAYVMTLSLLACLFLFVFCTVNVAQAGIIGTVLGAIVANGKVPLAYFFDGVAMSDQDKAPVPPAPADPVKTEVLS